MKTALHQGESIIKEGRANLQRGIQTVGGRLCLTNQRLIFEAHKFNFQRGHTEIDVSRIQSTSLCWTRFLRFIPLFPNSLAVSTKDGKEYRFVLLGREAWAGAIEVQIRASA